MYIAVRPDDGEAYAQLADTYKNMSDQTRRIAMLQRSLSLKPSLSRAKELAELYRDNRQTDSELALLSQYELKMTLQSGLRYAWHSCTSRMVSRTPRFVC